MEINLGKLPFDLDFHPSSPLVATALINGDLHLYRYATDSQPQRLLDIHAHDESCRAVRFVDSGRKLVCVYPRQRHFAEAASVTLPGIPVSQNCSSNPPHETSTEMDSI